MFQLGSLMVRVLSAGYGPVTLTNHAPWWTSVNFRFTRVEAGEGIYRFRSGEIEVQSGDVLFIQPGSRYVVVNRTLHLNPCAFTLDAGGKPVRYLPEFPEVVRLRLSGHAGDVLRAAMADIVRCVALGESADRVEAQMAVLFSLVHTRQMNRETPHRIPDRFLDCAARLTLHPEERASMAEFAAAAGYSIVQFRRLFKTYFKMSPKEYAVAQRLRQADHLLRQEQMSVKEAAQSLGYPDLYAFSRQFRKKRGCPPSVLRGKTQVKK